MIVQRPRRHRGILLGERQEGRELGRERVMRGTIKKAALVASVAAVVAILWLQTASSQVVQSLTLNFPASAPDAFTDGGRPGRFRWSRRLGHIHRRSRKRQRGARDYPHLARDGIGPIAPPAGAVLVLGLLGRSA